MQVVLDASVVLKLVVQEPGSDEALELLERAEERIAPDWLGVEMAGALSNKVKYSRLLAIHAERCLEAYPRFLDRLVPSAPLLADVLRLAIRLRHPVYDCLYLALAMSENTRVITADRKLHAQAAAGGLERHVELLTW
jgi:predicted nucleic acid-binding protein